MAAGTGVGGDDGRAVGGADTSGAPSPSEGNGVRPVSTGAAADEADDSDGDTGEAAGAGAGRGAGAGSRTRASEVALRLPNKATLSQLFLARTFHKLRKDRRQQAATGPLGFRASGQRLRHLAEHLRRLMVRRHLSN